MQQRNDHWENKGVENTMKKNHAERSQERRLAGWEQIESVVLLRTRQIIVDQSFQWDLKGDSEEQYIEC